MKKDFILFFAIFAVVFIACNDKKADFENIIEITPEDAVDYGLPEVHFKFSYPEDENILYREAQDGIKNLSYAHIDYLQNGLSVEEIAIGYCKGCVSNGKDVVKKLLDDLSSQFQYQLNDFTVLSNDYIKFDGEKRNLLKFSFTAPDSSIGFAPGEYIGIMVVYLPGKGHNNGVTFVYLANKRETEIEDYSNFGEKGFLNDIFHTFRFVE